jgi:hypothetical protein
MSALLLFFEFFFFFLKFFFFEIFFMPSDPSPIACPSSIVPEDRNHSLYPALYPDDADGFERRQAKWDFAREQLKSLTVLSLGAQVLSFFFPLVILSCVFICVCVCICACM